MKRLMSLLLVSALLLCVAQAALADQTFSTKYFTLGLPDEWIIDTEDLEEYSDENVEVLGFLGEPDEIGLFVLVYLSYYEDLKDISLWNSDASEIQLYADAVLEDLEDDRPVYLGAVMAGSIPFVLFRAEDEDGEYLYADTMTNGYAIVFLAYVTDEDGNQYPLSDSNIEDFRNILATFQPVT